MDEPIGGLNRVIATDLGWTDYTEDGYDMYTRDWYCETMVNPKGEQRAIPDFEHDLNEALSLFESLPPECTPRLVRMIVPNGQLAYQWRAVIMYTDGRGEDKEAMNTNAARAVCEAWLLWRGSNTP